ncbi:MAG TPA: DUF692 domain-containing protein, partial [Lysobacter sp.]|nr:DUF692 domain-containing protein [Lysobacter sp.]
MKPSAPNERKHYTGLPVQAGVGLKATHVEQLLADAQRPAFVEVHAENYLGAGGAPHAWLTRVREQCALSVHGVGLSIGATAKLDEAHLDHLATLIDRYQPDSFSEHLAWSTHSDTFVNDLLPLPYTTQTLNRVCEHIDRVQERLQLRMLLENPATYVEFAASSMAEPDFIAEVINRTGCGLLLDVNNVHVTCINHHRDPRAYLDALPLHAVGEIHLAGFTTEVDAAGDPLLIDDHGSPVAEVVWALYAHGLRQVGPVATLIEWDNDV